MPRGLELIDAADPRVEAIWRSLEQQSHPTYFLTWGWIENWLASLPVDERPPLAVVAADGAPAAAFFLGRRRVRRALVMTSNALYFNATGSRRHDAIGIEHNGLLAAPGARRSLAGLLDLLPDEWDEVHLPAIDRFAFDDLGATPAGARLAQRYRIRIERETLAPFVDLDAVRSVDGGYIALLGPQARTDLRRARRASGELALEVAEDRVHALDIWTELRRLQPGRCDPWCDRLHRRLIEQRTQHGEIQLARVRDAGRTLGCLMSFVHDGRVLFHRAGFARPSTAALCHAAVIEHNAAAGHAVYDLRGEADQDLATGANRLVWLRVQRPRFAFEDSLQRWTQRLLGERPLLQLKPA